MNAREKNSPKLDDLLAHARQDWSTRPSIAPQVRRRLAETTVAPKPPLFSMALLGLILLMGVIFAIPRYQRATHGSHVVFPPDFTLQIGGTRLTELTGAITQRGSVVIIWSYRGDDVTAPQSPDGRAGKYRVVRLAEERTADDATLVCSLFIPDPMVIPSLQPPLISARSAKDGTITAGASVHLASDVELADDIRSVGFIASPNILEQVNKQTQP